MGEQPQMGESYRETDFDSLFKKKKKLNDSAGLSNNNIHSLSLMAMCQTPNI